MRPFRVGIIILACLCVLASVAFAQQSPPAMPGATMQIPWADFKDILAKLEAAGQSPTEELPPYDALLATASYTAEIVGDLAKVTVDAGIVVYKQKGYAKVPVLPTSVPLESASLDGKPTALVNENDGLLHLVVSGAGVHSLTLSLAYPISDKGGPRSFSMMTLRSPINAVEVRIPTADQQVMLEPGGIMDSENVGGKTVARGTFSPVDRITVKWSRKADVSQKGEPRISAEIRTMVTVGEGLGVYTSIVEFDIRHKPTSLFTFLLPADVTVADVSTDGLVDWNAEKLDDKTQRLSVQLSFEAVGRHQIAVTYEQALPAGDDIELNTADIRAENVVREVGYLAIAVRTNIQVTTSNPVNLASIDISELPADTRGGGDLTVLHAFKYIKHPAAVTLHIVRHTDASVLTSFISNADYRMMITDAGKLVTEATYEITNRSKQFLTMTLPANTDLWGVFRNDQPIKAAAKDGQVLIPIFEGGLTKSSTVRVLTYTRLSKFHLLGARNLALPTVDVGINRATLELYAPYEYRYLAFGGTLDVSTGGVTTVMLEGNQAPSAGDAEKGWADDKMLSLDENINYRNERSQVAQQISDIPVQLSNAAYFNTMVRGALPVKVNIQWTGEIFRFAKEIVDPGEKLDVSFLYHFETRDKIVRMVLFLAALYAVYLLLTALLSRRRPAYFGVAQNLRRKVIIAAVVFALMAIPYYEGIEAGINGAIFAVLAVALRWLVMRIRTGRKLRAEKKQAEIVQQAEATKEQPPVDDSDSEEGGEQ